jgi:hypothetical protein
LAFSFPFYIFFEPADYLRITPTWGVILIYAAFEALVIGAVETAPGAKENHAWWRDKRRELKIRGCMPKAITIGVAGFAANLFLFVSSYPVTKYWGSIGITFYVFAILALIMRQIEKACRSESPQTWRGARALFLRLTIPIILCSFLVGFLTVKPGVEASFIQVFRSKTEKPVAGQIVYMLNRFVIIWHYLPYPLSKDEVVSLNLDDIRQIGQWEETTQDSTPPHPFPSPAFPQPTPTAK